MPIPEMKTMRDAEMVRKSASQMMAVSLLVRVFGTEGDADVANRLDALATEMLVAAREAHPVAPPPERTGR